MWNLDVYRLLAAEKILRAQDEARYDRLVREALGGTADGLSKSGAFRPAPHAQKEEPQTA